RRGAVEGYRLYRSGIGHRVLVASWASDSDDVDDEIRRLGVPLLPPDALARAILEGGGVPPESIVVLPDRVDGTEVEIEDLGRYARAHPPERWLFVTARSHTARAGRLLRAVVPAGTSVAVRAPAGDPFSPDAWWTDRGQARELVIEYVRWLD